MSDKKTLENDFRTAYDQALALCREKKFTEAKKLLMEDAKKFLMAVYNLKDEEKGRYSAKARAITNLIQEINKREKESETMCSENMPQTPKGERKSFDELLKLIDEMCCQNAIKKKLTEHLKVLEYKKMRSAYFSNKDREALPIFAFFGNEATGKSTVAKLLAEIYYSYDLIKTNQVFELTRVDLVGGYIGASKEKCRKAISSARDGIAFFDRIEQITNFQFQKGGFFEEEALSAITQEVMDFDHGIMIFSGSEKIISDLLIENQSLSVRIADSNYFYFEDLTAEERYSVFLKILEKGKFTLSEDALSSKEEILSLLMKTPYNAASATLLAEDSIERQARRIYCLTKKGQTFSTKELSEITADDIFDRFKKDDSGDDSYFRKMFEI